MTDTTATPPKDLHAHEIDKVYGVHTDLVLSKYKAEHAFSITDPETYWADQGRQKLDWFTPFEKTMTGGLDHGDVAFFAGGKLNACYNAIDRHVGSHTNANELALVWEGDEPTDIRRLTYAQLLRKTCQIANALKGRGVAKGDVVTVYMPMIPELAMTMLACARIGAVHSVVFAGFSSEALAQRVSAAKSQYVVTADVGKRGSKTIDLKGIVNDAVGKLDCPTVVKSVLVWERFFDESLEEQSKDAPYAMQPKDVRMDLLVAGQRPYCVPEAMDAEDNLFLLYTSGSTGKPKGLVHTTGGYALYAMMTTATTFDITKGDLFACVADCGWITGHSEYSSCVVIL